MHIAGRRRVGDQRRRGRIQAEPGQRDGRRDIGVLREAARRLAGAAAIDLGRAGQPVEVHDLLGRRVAPAGRRLAADIDDLAQAPFARRRQRVDAADGAGDQRQPPPAPLRRGSQPLEQHGIGKRAG